MRSSPNSEPFYQVKPKNDDELRPEYNLSQLKGGLRGKYFKRAMAGTNLVLIEPDLLGRPEWDDQQEILRYLHRAFFTRDLGFFRARLCHKNYCLAVIMGKDGRP